MTKTTVESITTKYGIAGEVSRIANVIFPGTTITRAVEFRGSTYGAPGPILMWMHADPRAREWRVDAPERFGERFDNDWVCRFFGDPS